MAEPSPQTTTLAEPGGPSLHVGSARAQKREQTRERLFEAALREFREFGLAGAQIDRIAKAAGVVRGTFYFHFPSKDDVLLELARRVNARIVRRVAVLANSGHDANLNDLLRRVNDAIIDEHTRIGQAGLQAELAALYMRRPNDMNVPADQNAPSLAGMLSEIFGRCRRAGEIQNPLSDDLAAAVFMMSLFGIFVRIPGGESRREACEALIGVFANGLRLPEAAAPAEEMGKGPI